MNPARPAKIIRLFRFDDGEDPDPTGPFGLPVFTLVGSPIGERSPAPPVTSSYAERYPPQLDEAVVLDMEVDTERKCGEIWRAK